VRSRTQQVLETPIEGTTRRLLRSGGEPSWQGGFQQSGKVLLPIRRSGGLEIETAGNYNALGWSLHIADGDWWRASNLSQEPNGL
jgi:hypothetical protein